MHYVVIDFVVRDNSGGILSILQDVNKFARRHSGDFFTFVVGTENLVVPAPNINVILRHDLQRSYTKRLFFDFFGGAKFINSLHADVVISLQNTAVLGLNVPEMLYVHQPLPIEKNYRFSFFKKSERKMAFYQHFVGSIIKMNLRLFHNGAITVQTHWMKKELKHYTRQQIFVTRPSIDRSDYSGQVLGKKSKNFFFPSTAMIYKNHQNLIEAYKSLPEKIKAEYNLILTISKDEYTKLYKKTEDDPHIKFYGRIPRSEVLTILSHSILVFPSKIETLGLPLIEGMILQRQIAASDISPVIEVTEGYDSVTYFNPDDRDSISSALLKVLQMNLAKRKFEDSYKNGWQAFFDNVGAIKDEK